MLLVSHGGLGIAVGTVQGASIMVWLLNIVWGTIESIATGVPND